MKLRVKLLVAAVCVSASAAALAAPSAACVAHGDASFNALTHGQYVKAGANFAPTTASMLTPAKLKQLWEQLQTRAGAFHKLGKFEARTVQGHEVLAAPMDFANVQLAAVFACDARDRITSWSVLNPATVPGLLPPASAPTEPAGSPR